MEVFPIDKKVEQLFKEVSRRIFRLQNGRSLDSMERIGADTRDRSGQVTSLSKIWPDNTNPI